MIKPFYIHRHHGPGKLPKGTKYRGFTALFQPDNVEPITKVRLSLARCSKEDAFARKEGRSQAHLQTPEVFHKRDIPQVMAEICSRCNLPEQYEQDWYWILKFVI